MSREADKVQVVLQRAAGVSRALWPTTFRRGVHTGLVAQQRRYLIIHARWWLMMTNILKSPLFRVCLLILLSMALGGAIMDASFLNHWESLVLAAVLLLFLLPLARGLVRHSQATQTIVSATMEVLPPQQSTAPMRRLGHGEGLSPFHIFKSLPGLATVFHEAETPLPMPPLVRVLETYDLSTTAIEHFVERDTAEIPVELAEDEEEVIYSQD